GLRARRGRAAGAQPDDRAACRGAVSTAAANAAPARRRASSEAERWRLAGSGRRWLEPGGQGRMAQQVLTEAPDFSRVSPSGRVILSRIAQLLMTGYSGEITLRCKDGGVQMLRTTQEFRPSDFED